MFDVATLAANSERPTLTVTGDLDAANAPLFTMSADRFVAGHAGTPVRLDFRGVGFIDSAGINALVRLHGAVDERGGTLEMARCSRYVERVLRLVGLENLLA